MTTSGWGYLHLRNPNVSGEDLRPWAQKIKSQNWQEVYAFFKHEDDGAGPKLAKHFLNLALQIE